MRDLELGRHAPQARPGAARGSRGYAEQAAKLDAELTTAIAELNEALRRHPHA